MTKNKNSNKKQPFLQEGANPSPMSEKHAAKHTPNLHIHIPSTKHEHKHLHAHHHEVNAKTITYLMISFAINMVLSVVELVAGVIGGSIALIGDALHNTSDAFSILIAVIAYKIGIKKATDRYTFGFKRAEIIGGFVNLILLFISGCYLLVEGIEKLIMPDSINGSLIVWISVLALLIDTATARLSHHDAGHNSNMKMLFLHNLADALGSVGVIISGLCVIYFQWYFVDGLVALMIAGYMIFQSIISFPSFIRILMNAAPDHIDIKEVIHSIEAIDGVQNVHHLHLWMVAEHETSLECHLVVEKPDIIKKVQHVLRDEFGIRHCNLQLEETQTDCEACCL